MSNFETPVQIYQDPGTVDNDGFSLWTVISANGTGAMRVDVDNYDDQTVLRARAAYTGDGLAVNEQGRVTGNLDTHGVASNGVPQISFWPNILGKDIELSVSPPLTDLERQKAAVASFVVGAWQDAEASRHR
jgi:hypothetical protein